MNRRKTIVGLAICLIAFAIVTVAGCSTSNTPGGTGTGGPGTTPGGTGTGGSGTAPGSGYGFTPGSGMMGSPGSSQGSYSTVGEQIFMTGLGTDGREIAHSAPRVSQGALMMGGGGCASCHAPDGRGGTIRMMMGTSIKAPDITYDALSAAGFTEATIKTAIRDGLDEAGK